MDSQQQRRSGKDIVFPQPYFNIYLEQALGLWGEKKSRIMGIPTCDNTIYTLHFADDQLLTA
jgi:hypothetical protein